MLGNTDMDRCMRGIYNAFVEHYRDDEGVPRWQIRSDFKPHLEPFFGMDYPLSHVGVLPRVTRKYMENWINVVQLTDYFMRTERLGPLISRVRPSLWSARDVVKDVLSFIGTASYTDEWSKKSASIQLEDILESSIGVAADANILLAKELEERVVYHFAKKRRRLKILDLGVGMGDTIMPVMQMMDDLAAAGRIPKNYMNYTQVFLVDVSERALDITMKRLTRNNPGYPFPDGRTPVGNIVKVPTNFVDIQDDARLNDQRGKIDIIVSGAAICHQTDLFPFFRFMHEMLSEQGVMHIWDWYNGPSWAARRLRMSKDDERRTVHYIEDEYGNMYEPFVVEDGGSLASLYGRERKDLCERLRTARGVSTVYEMNHEDAAVVLANFRTLLSVLGYVGKGDDGLRLARVVGKEEEDVEDHLKRLFDEYIHKEHGFSYLDDFLVRAVPAFDDQRPIKEESAYYLIEGYGDDYAELMRRAGFSFGMNEYFIEVYQRRKDEGLKSTTDMVPAFQIRYTQGTK